MEYHKFTYCHVQYVFNVWFISLVTRKQLKISTYLWRIPEVLFISPLSMVREFGYQPASQVSPFRDWVVFLFLSEAILPYPKKPMVWTSYHIILIPILYAPNRKGAINHHISSYIVYSFLSSMERAQQYKHITSRTLYL